MTAAIIIIVVVATIVFFVWTRSNASNKELELGNAFLDVDAKPGLVHAELKTRVERLKETLEDKTATVGDINYGLIVAGPALYFTRNLSDKVLFELSQYIIAQADYYMFCKDYSRGLTVRLNRVNAEVFQKHFALSDSEYESLVNDRLQLYGNLLAKCHKKGDWQELTDTAVSVLIDAVGHNDSRPRFWQETMYWGGDPLKRLTMAGLFAEWIGVALPLIQKGVDLGAWKNFARSA